MLAKDPRLRPTATEVEAALAELTGTGRPGGLLDSPARPVTVGREAERTILRGSFEAAAAGRGLLVCVTGEPGLGKTTLVETSSKSWRPATGPRPSPAGAVPSGWRAPKPTCRSWRRWTACSRAKAARRRHRR